MHTVPNPEEFLAKVEGIENMQAAARAKTAQLRKLVELQIALKAQGIDAAQVRALGRRGMERIPDLGEVGSAAVNRATTQGWANIAYMKDGSEIELNPALRRN